MRRATCSPCYHTRLHVRLLMRKLHARLHPCGLALSMLFGSEMVPRNLKRRNLGFVNGTWIFLARCFTDLPLQSCPNLYQHCVLLEPTRCSDTGQPRERTIRCGTVEREVNLHVLPGAGVFHPTIRTLHDRPDSYLRGIDHQKLNIPSL